jgi:hypothetical protein
MLLHLTNQTQIQGWLAIYKTMQYKFHFGSFSLKASFLRSSSKAL